MLSVRGKKNIHPAGKMVLPISVGLTMTEEYERSHVTFLSVASVSQKMEHYSPSWSTEASMCHREKLGTRGEIPTQPRRKEYLV
jgi:hypothetical protein